jgi:hypothetical protein
MAKVKVYKFQTYVGNKDESPISQRMGTKEFIEKIGGAAIEGSELEVDSSKVDAEGKTETGFKG